MPMRVDVVIPTWNAKDLLDRCLRTLAEQTVPHTTIVVDNGSADGTVEHVRDRFPSVRVVELDENLGFGPAVNRGVAAGTAPCVVLVNNDVECEPYFLEHLVRPLEVSPRIGMVAALLLRPGRGTIDSYGLELDATLAAFARFDRDPYDAEAIHERGLAAPSGGAAAYRREAYEQAGGFDERLFAYMEDVDIALRMRALGWGCAGARDAIGVHLGSATAGRRSVRQV
ncbi:MAG: glycosyltransferase family 2 protein, partial [Actinomycetota bacterium]|nr:glycosyltransferase family 2 protein [Actinomycetota bacterium]